MWFLFSVNISSTLWLFLYTGAVLLHDLDTSELPTNRPWEGRLCGRESYRDISPTDKEETHVGL